MDNHLRTRILPAVLMILALLVGAALLAFSISRVFLAVPEIAATFIALAIATYILLVAAFVGKEQRISARALTSGLIVGLVGLLAAGALAAQAGIRELHPPDDADGVPPPAAPGFGEIVDEIPAGAFVWVAIDIDYSDAPDTMPAGEQVIAIDNTGAALVHNVVFEGTDIKVEASGGERAIGTFTVEPGTYEYYCDIPGHRAAGMEGTIEVSG